MSLMKSVFIILSLLHAVVLIKYLFLEGRNRYLFEKLDAKKKTLKRAITCRFDIKLLAPRYKGLNCLIAVYYRRVEPRYNERVYDEFLAIFFSRKLL